MVQAVADTTFTPDGPVFAPDDHGFLRLTSHLAYNDAPWLVGSGGGGLPLALMYDGAATATANANSSAVSSSTTASQPQPAAPVAAATAATASPPGLALHCHLVHPKISNHVAERLGVPSLRRLLLAQSADMLSLGLHGVVGGPTGAEAFGQSEALTTRLRHIIQVCLCVCVGGGLPRGP